MRDIAMPVVMGTGNFDSFVSYSFQKTWCITGAEKGEFNNGSS